MKTIGIIGYGFVGKSVFEGMKHAFDIFCYDKMSGVHQCKDGEYTNLEPVGIRRAYFALLKETDGPIFVCLPTPMKADGTCDTSILEDVFDVLNEGQTGRVFVIKSTMTPGTTERLNSQYENLHICYNPEFLREATAVEDFKNQDRIIIGGPREATNVVKQMYETSYPDVPVTKTSSTIAELVKYTTNCFLATKVAFANEMSLLCESLDVDYDKVVEYATKDKRLGQSHWAVPGPDGKRGFGGSCFPKDLNALMTLFERQGVVNNVMKGAWETNLAVRPEKDWEQLKGRAVSE